MALPNIDDLEVRHIWCQNRYRKYTLFFYTTNFQIVGYCVSGETKIVASKHTKAAAVKDLSDLICPDQRTVCDSGTCCQADNDNYNCCPLKNAVCCKDNVHCCPKDFKCVEGGQFVL